MNHQPHQETTYASPLGTFELARYPREQDPNLRAWSAADDFLLDYFHSELASTMPPGTLLIANDSFGALTVCLHSYRPVLWSDSYVTTKALQRNLQRNQIDAHTGDIQCLPATEVPPQGCQVVLMQLPKSHGFLRFQLARIAASLAPDGIVIAAVMTKHFHNNSLAHFEELIGETHTTLARKKARLIIARHTRVARQESTQPLESWANHYPLSPFASAELITLPNVFSAAKLDIGTRALLPHIPQQLAQARILDLGCGNGALGICAGLHNPDATITFCDESWLAICSAELSAAQAGIKARCHFLVTDTLENAPGDQDLILCNPPFHQQNSMHREIALRMFRQARRHLTPNGQLLIVANGHLDYPRALRKLFSRVSIVDRNRKFIVIAAQP